MPVNSKKYNIVSDFGLRFRLLMSYHDLTLKSIAAYTDNAISTVGTWKNGRVPSSPETIKRLAELFHVKESFLLHGRTNPEERLSSTSERILKDIELLIEELDATSLLGRKSKQCVEESQAKYSQAQKATKQNLLEDLESYFHALLDEANQHPGGLEHVWYQLRREFPISLFRDIDRSVKR